MLINPSGWRTKSPDPKSLKETGFREWLHENSHPKLSGSWKNRGYSEGQLSSFQFHWNSKYFDPCIPFIILKNLFVSIKMLWRQRRLLDDSCLAWNKMLYKHIGRRQSLPCKVYNINGNSRARQSTRKQSGEIGHRGDPSHSKSAASHLFCRHSSKLPEHETSTFHLREANHHLPKTNQPLTFSVF